MKSNIWTVILNYRRPDDTLECVRSVLKSDTECRIVVVDNASGGSSLQIFRDSGLEFDLLANPLNAGFAGGVNAGVRYALEKGAEYVFILNNDAVVLPDTIGKLLRRAESSEDILFAAKICRFDNPSILDSTGTSMDWFRLRPRIGRCGQVDDPAFYPDAENLIYPGAALFMKRDFFTLTGFFDEDFFLLHEDADLCLRNIKAGRSNDFVADAVVLHRVSATLSAYPFLSSYYSTRNFIYLAWRYAGPAFGLTMLGVLLLSIKNLFRLTLPAERVWAEGFFSGVWGAFCGRKGRHKSNP